jgi:hypothetical protein
LKPEFGCVLVCEAMINPSLLKPVRCLTAAPRILVV